MQLSIIIVNYNVKFFLEQCLLSVAKATKNIDVEILVVDNNSTDGSRAFFENKFPTQTILFTWNDHNTGFAVANNEALKKAKDHFLHHQHRFINFRVSPGISHIQKFLQNITSET